MVGLDRSLHAYDLAGTVGWWLFFALALFFFSRFRGVCIREADDFVGSGSVGGGQVSLGSGGGGKTEDERADLADDHGFYGRMGLKHLKKVV